jgi:hypothetical protein
MLLELIDYFFELPAIILSASLSACGASGA